MSSSIAFRPNLRSKGMPGASKLLFAIILSVLLCNFCKWFFSYTTAVPHGIAITKMRFYNPAYSLFKVSKGRIDLACLKKLTDLDTLEEGNCISNLNNCHADQDTLLYQRLLIHDP